MGFAALPNQLHRKSVKKGFDFTLMVAGLTGDGCVWGGPQETLAVSSPDQEGLSCLQGSQAWGNPPSSTACFSPISMRTGNSQRPVVRPSRLPRYSVSPQAALSSFSSGSPTTFWGTQAARCFSETLLKNGWGQL